MAYSGKFTLVICIGLNLAFSVPLAASGQMAPSTPEGVASRSPAFGIPYDPRPLLPGLPIEGDGIPSYADPRFIQRRSPRSGRPEILERNINDGFIFVKGSVYLMGGDESSTVTAPHRVRLSDYWISPYEVYWKLWDDVYRWAIQHGYRFLSNGSAMDGDAFNRLDKAVAMVSWYDAIVWLNAYSELRQLEPVYLVNSTVFRYVLRSAVETGLLDQLYVRWQANGYRLPTEAEWEFAARGGLSGRATLYSGSNNPYDVGWFKKNVRDKQLQPAGTLYANGLGLYDMSGNLGEWCWDWYQPDYYYTSPAVDPRGPGSGRKRVVRGGSWQDDEEALLVASRQAAYPKTFNFKIGFRPVRRARYLPAATADDRQAGAAGRRPGSSTAQGTAGENDLANRSADDSAGKARERGDETTARRPPAGYIYSLYSKEIIPYNNEPSPPPKE